MANIRYVPKPLPFLTGNMTSGAMAAVCLKPAVAMAQQALSTYSANLHNKYLHGKKLSSSDYSIVTATDISKIAFSGGPRVAALAGVYGPYNFSLEYGSKKKGWRATHGLKNAVGN
jgi:hypothetical protein